MYGTMYGMHRTTIYLPDDLKAAVADEARRSGRSEAEVIRAAVSAVVTPVRPEPRPGLFSGEPIADRVDELLAGFGER
jgi:hypothetical protein